MELTNEFRVSIPVEECWGVLTDVERIAPCMPGAELREVDGEEYRGVVKVKVGPVTAQYKGTAHFVEKDDEGHRAILRAEGRETRGQGNANATITASLEPDGDEATRVSVVTDLAVSGKVAQFGRGVLADVSAKLLTQFVDCLEATILGRGSPAEGSPAEQDPAPAPVAVEQDAPPGPASSAEHNGVGHPVGPSSTNGNTNGQGGQEPFSAPRKITARAAEPVDLLDVAGGSVAKRLIPAMVAAILLALGGVLVLRKWRG